MRHGQPDGGALTEEAEGAERDRAHWEQGGERDRELAPRDDAQLGRGQATAACTLAKPVGIHVGDPEDEHAHRDDRVQPPEVVVGNAVTAGRQ